MTAVTRHWRCKKPRGIWTLYQKGKTKLVFVDSIARDLLQLFELPSAVGLVMPCLFDVWVTMQPFQISEFWNVLIYLDKSDLSTKSRYWNILRFIKTHFWSVNSQLNLCISTIHRFNRSLPDPSPRRRLERCNVVDRRVCALALALVLWWSSWDGWWRDRG